MSKQDIRNLTLSPELDPRSVRASSQPLLWASGSNTQIHSPMRPPFYPFSLHLAFSRLAYPPPPPTPLHTHTIKNKDKTTTTKKSRNPLYLTLTTLTYAMVRVLLIDITPFPLKLSLPAPTPSFS